MALYRSGQAATPYHAQGVLKDRCATWAPMALFVPSPMEPACDTYHKIRGTSQLMKEIFKNQLMHELKQAGYYQAVLTSDEEAIIPMPDYPDLRICQDHIRFTADASQAERDLAHQQLRELHQRTEDACRAWEHSQEMPGKNMGAENFRFLSEFNDVMLAARNDGVHGLYFTTWEYNHDRSAVEHGHYTSSFAGALEDYATRAGLVPREQIIDPANAPVLYKALQTMESNYWLTKEHED